MTLWDVVRDPQIRRLLFDAIRMARERLFSTDGHAPQLVVEATEQELVDALRPYEFAPNWPLSYHYRGEDRQLVRFYSDEFNYPERPYRQDHLRLFVDEHPDGEIGVAAHSEANAFVHRDAHLDGAGLSSHLGAVRLEEILKTEEIPHRWVDVDDSNGGDQ